MALFTIPEQEQEIWKDVVGFEGYYQVSNLGRVKSLDRTNEDGRQLKGKLLVTKGDRYISTQLHKDGRSYNKLVHRLVAEAFVPNPTSLPEVNHKDKNVANNNASNLEWVTPSENHNHGVTNRTNYSYKRSVICLENSTTFSSISAAGRSVNADATQIIESIEAKRCCKGLTFVYADAVPDDVEAYLDQAHAKYQSFHKRPIMKNSKKVIIVETGEVFDSIASAARSLQCDTATIRNRIKAAKPFGGVTLKFAE